MIVIHQVSKVSTSRLYGSFVSPPDTLTLPTVKLIRCQMMKSSSVRPPQRIVRDERLEALFFFTTYWVLRARLARFHRAAAEATCTTSATMRTVRMIHSAP